jgi:hypothetical protein
MRKKRINVYMSQGLGNQLFIYSYILNLIQINASSKLKVRILFNRKSKSDREFLLEKLIKADSNQILFSSNRHFAYFTKIFLYKIIKNEKFLRKLRIFHEKNIFTFDKELLEVNNNSLVVGYYISNKYVDRIFPTLENRIASWLSTQETPNGIAEINSEDVVVMHIRRGDTVGKIAKVRGLLTCKYYEDALEIISHARKIELRRVIAITDDIKTSQNDLRGIRITDWVGPDEVNAIQALKIFSNAKNFIGANSTLSWWSAKLSSTSLQNIQILPTPWLGFKESVADKSLFIPNVTYTQAK